MVTNEPEDPGEVFVRMVELHPDIFNPAALKLSAMGVFNVSEEPRVGSYCL